MVWRTAPKPIKRVSRALAVDFHLGLAEADFDREFHFARTGESIFQPARILCGICAGTGKHAKTPMISTTRLGNEPRQ